MDDWITAREVVARSRQQGLEVSERSLRLYVTKGLFPRPKVLSRPGGGRSGYYDQRVVGLVGLILGLQEGGQTLEQIKDFLDRLQGIAKRDGRDPLTFQLQAARALGHQASPQADDRGDLPSRPIWAAMGGPILAAMVREGLKADASQLTELRVQAYGDGFQVSVPVYLSPRAVAYTIPEPEDAGHLGFLLAGYVAESTGQHADPQSGTEVNSWIEASSDLSRDNFIVARRSPALEAPPGLSGAGGGLPLLGFAYLGVEPERLRAGQVRLEGPYVVPEYRSQGIGRGLMRRAEGLAGERGASYVDSFVRPEAGGAVSFLRHFGYRPEFFYWVLELDMSGAGEPTGAVSPETATSRGLEVLPVKTPEDFRQYLEILRRVNEGRPGFYPPEADDLCGLDRCGLPWGHVFTALLSGKPVGVLWHSKGSRRVYVNVVPELEGTWAEAYLWSYMISYARGRGLSTIRTEVTSFFRQGSKAPKGLGFEEKEMLICYRKTIGPAPRPSPDAAGPGRVE